MKLLHRALLSLIIAWTSIAQSSGDSPAIPARLSEERAVSTVRQEIDRQVAAGEFSGAVLIARAGKPIFAQAYGYADRETHSANTLDTKFRFGSMGKMFTAVSILQLVQAGKIELDDPLSKYLPDYPNKDVGRVTIHQLLTHTGGTGNIFTPEYAARRLQIREHIDYVQLFGSRGLRFEPGSQYEYSNYGMILLGRIIEVVSGERYPDYVRAHIFKPSGMASTDNLPEDRHIQDLSINYTRHGASEAASAARSDAPPAPLTAGTDTLPYSGTSAGGGYSTVGDFLKFATAVTSNTLLNAHYTELLLAGKVKTPMGPKYAYGFEDGLTADGIRVVGHGGGAPGMSGNLAIFPTSGYTVVVLANFDPPAARALATFIAQYLPLKR